jgi:hypothetical protein
MRARLGFSDTFSSGLGQRLRGLQLTISPGSSAELAVSSRAQGKPRPFR